MQTDGYDYNLYYNSNTCDNLRDFMFYNLSDHFLANTNNTTNDIITRDIANDTTYDRKNIQQLIHVLMQIHVVLWLIFSSFMLLAVIILLV